MEKRLTHKLVAVVADWF